LNPILMMILQKELVVQVAKGIMIKKRKKGKKARNQMKRMFLRMIIILKGYYNNHKRTKILCTLSSNCNSSF